MHRIVWRASFCAQGDAEEANSEARQAEDKARRAMLDAAKIADELRLEQERAQQLEREKKEMEVSKSPETRF